MKEAKFRGIETMKLADAEAEDVKKWLFNIKEFGFNVDYQPTVKNVNLVSPAGVQTPNLSGVDSSEIFLLNLNDKMSMKSEIGFERPNPPRNLRTHFQETMEAMAEIEGKAWLKTQETATELGVCGAREYLEEADDESSPYTIYGDGGVNRWVVRPDGTVELSRHNATRGGLDDAGDIQKAKNLGFKIFE